MNTDRPPWLRCAKHGSVRGYKVCEHIWKLREPPALCIAPDVARETLGRLYCYRIHREELKEGFILACELCLVERGYLPEEALVKTGPFAV